jgi:hypothetical protein
LVRLEQDSEMSHSCQFIVGAQGSGTQAGPSGVQYIYCDAPASIKHNSLWLCAEHYDEVESGKPFSNTKNWKSLTSTLE